MTLREAWHRFPDDADAVDLVLKELDRLAATFRSRAPAEIDVKDLAQEVAISLLRVQLPEMEKDAGVRAYLRTALYRELIDQIRKLRRRQKGQRALQAEADDLLARQLQQAGSVPDFGYSDEDLAEHLAKFAEANPRKGRMERVLELLDLHFGRRTRAEIVAQHKNDQAMHAKHMRTRKTLLDLLRKKGDSLKGELVEALEGFVKRLKDRQ